MKIHEFIRNRLIEEKKKFRLKKQYICVLTNGQIQAVPVKIILDDGFVDEKDSIFAFVQFLPLLAMPEELGLKLQAAENGVLIPGKEKIVQFSKPS